MTEKITSQDEADSMTPFLVFFGVGFLFGLFLAYLHIRTVRSMVVERLSHIPKAKKVKVKKGKKKKGKKKK
ncbi:hypothetical protein V3C99_012351 [Haemonchus contortus]|uniref:Small integral membrane protein 15 n=2 Tax=Haemonchus TaxID=6288 RepID=A0A0N4WHF4_HAEPC|nr:unnamed protein product [Haemonchus contortus]VDO39767.1 unnamed protein product [Haemonchus placei]